jgi:hypothetical protein
VSARDLSDDELRQVLIARGHDKAAAALDESVRRRTKIIRERLHADLQVAEGYEEAAALVKDAGAGDDPRGDDNVDMNRLIRRAAWGDDNPEP